MKLNLGAGEERAADFLSVDLRADVADVVADVRALPFADDTISEILAFDLLEHFWRDVTPELLAEWRRVLVPGGLLTVKVPNLRALADRLDAPDHEHIVANIYGGHRWGPDGAWDTHHWGWTPRTIARDLGFHGFTVVTNDEALNMTVVARKQ